MLEKIGSKGFETLSKPDETALKFLQLLLDEKPNPVVFEIGVGVGATTLRMAQMMQNKGSLVLFSRAKDVAELSADLGDLGFSNIDARWGSETKTYSGYHFDLATAVLEGSLSHVDFAYVDGGHVFHLDAPTTCILKEICSLGGYLIFDDWYWSLGASPTLSPDVNPQTGRDYDSAQIKASHVQMVCNLFMDRDERYKQVVLEGSTAVYKRIK